MDRGGAGEQGLRRGPGRARCLRHDRSRSVSGGAERGDAVLDLGRMLCLDPEFLNAPVAQLDRAPDYESGG